MSTDGKDACLKQIEYLRAMFTDPRSLEAYSEKPEEKLPKTDFLVSIIGDSTHHEVQHYIAGCASPALAIGGLVLVMFEILMRVHSEQEKQLFIQNLGEIGLADLERMLTRGGRNDDD